MWTGSRWASCCSLFLHRQKIPDLAYFLGEDLVRLQILLYLLARMDDGGMVAAAELVANGRIGDAEVLAQYIHDDLARLDYLFAAGLLVYALLFYGVEVGDYLHDV